MRLLIIGSDSRPIGEASRLAAARGAEVRVLEDVAAAFAELRQGRSADLLLIDFNDDVEGVVRALAEERIHMPVVAYGTAADARAAVRAIRAGAAEFLPLPPEAELIAAVLELAGASQTEFVGRDSAMLAALEMARKVAQSDANVLITGESGTGKEVMARYIHGRSRRADGPFISVNCAAIPEALLESELFGHEKGAFTGALSRRIGKFQEADGGTLLLDEVSEMDPRLQAKLLRALQEREIDRVGGSKPVPVNIRVLATSNRDLARAVREGQFREDLLYRLNVVNVRLPALRERPDDIAVLAGHFITRYAAANGVPPRPLTEEALDKLARYAWPGNVRELENCMHRAVLLATGTEITAEAILTQGMNEEPAGGTASAGGDNGQEEAGLVGRTVADVERRLILDTLDHTSGNRTHAATILGISIRTLRNKLRQYAADGERVPSAQQETPLAASG